MEIFKLSRRHRLLKVWLIAIAFQVGQLFSQLEVVAHSEPYLMEPQDGQWPVFSNNEWQDQTVLPLEFPSAHVLPPDDFIPFPPPAQPGADKQNFIVFDPDLAEAPDKEQHPLNKEGEASSYHFENEAKLSLYPANAISPQGHAEKTSAAFSSFSQQSTEGQEETSSLSQGKSHVRIIKKASEFPSITHPQEENAFQQPEAVVGKQRINDPAVGLVDDSENLQFQPNGTYVSQKRAHVDSQAIQPKKNNSLNSKKQFEDEVIAQIPQPNQRISPQSNQTPPSQPLTVITPDTPNPDAAQASLNPGNGRTLREISINFNNVAIIEYIRFISRISNKNFIFNDEDLQFNVTIVSEEPTTIENLMAALLQELRIRDLSLIEQGNNLIIHRNPRIRSPARIVADGTAQISSHESELVTRVFRLNTLDPIKASEIIRPLLSEDALIEVLRDTNNLILTDLVNNVNKIAQLISTLDAPNSGVTIGQYVVRNAFVDSLVDLANKILQPIAQGNPFVLVPHPVSNSIFIVSNAFLVEKALAILQNLDLNEGRTKILSLETLQPAYSASPSQPGETAREFPAASTRVGRPPIGGTEAGARVPFPGESVFGEGGTLLPSGAPVPGGHFESDLTPGYGPGGQLANPAGMAQSFPFGGLNVGGNLLPEGPPPGTPGFGPGSIGAEGRPSAIFDESRNFLPGGIGAASRWARDLPVGHIERTLFFIYKLRYRKGDNIEIALRKIANSLQLMGTANADLISAINSSQWIESSNALIFTGTAAALEKVRELILEVDVPLRQVFIEMLILDTTIQDSLTYSVDWINRFGGGTTTGEQGFLEAPRGAGIASADNFLGSVQSILPGGVCPADTVPACPFPVATGILDSGGFAASIIGTHLTHNGTRFSSIGALVRAIHTDTKAEILLNPKIITEDNNPAEVFVGGVDRYKTQSITNDFGGLVTNNFQFIDVGTTLRVTPLIGNNGIITLEIIQETTNEAATANAPDSGRNQDVNLVPVLTKTRTVTRVHVPNGFFVVLSGMIQDTETRSYARVPCIGGIPIIGALLGKTQNTNDRKRNLMLFLRPLIIDTDEDYEDITRRQQDIYREKGKFRRSWNYEIDEALNFGNIKSTDPDERNCSERNQR